MNNMELITKENTAVMDATENAMESLSNLPNLVENHFKKLEEVEKSVIAAMEKAESIHKQASRKVKVGFVFNKHSIEELQKVAEGLADSQLSAADAQKLQFEYQTQLAKMTEALFGLGMISIAANRSVVQEVKLRLKNASEHEINELERNELQKVVYQLQQQCDIMQKQEKLDKKVQTQQTKIEEIHADLDRKTSKDMSQDLAIQAQHEKNMEYDNLFEEKVQKDNVQDEAINKQIQKNLGYDKALEEGKLKDDEHDTVLADLEKKSEECSELLTTLSDISKSNSFRLSQLESRAVDFQNNINEQEEIISQNHLDILSLVEQVKSLSTSNDEQNSQIEALNIAIDGLKNSVNKKISKFFGVIFAIAAIIALILSIINLIV